MVNHGCNQMSHMSHSTMHKYATRINFCSYFVLHTSYSRQCPSTNSYDAFTSKNTPTREPGSRPQVQTDVERKSYPTRDHSLIPNSNLIWNTLRLVNTYTSQTHKYDIIESFQGRVDYMRIICGHSIILF